MRRLLPPLMLVACTMTSDPLSPSFSAEATAPAVFLIAGDIARCTTTRDEQTAALLDSLVGVHPDATVVPLGDLAYPTGTAANFANCFAPSWGRHLDRMRTVVGSHEYEASSTATPYWDYVGDRGGARGKGYYSWETGSWHIIVLNTNSKYVSTRPGTAQDTWLAADLAANHKPCILALFHHPRFYGSASGVLPTPPAYTLHPWQRLTAAKADLNLVGSTHIYDRYAPQRPDGTPDSMGMRQIIVGTGGASGSPLMTANWPASEVQASALGVLKLELGSESYTWRFVSVSGRTFTDGGTTKCHGAAPSIEGPPPPADSTPAPLPPPPDSTPEPPPPEEPPPPPPPPPSIELRVSGRVDATKQYMALDWTGATGAGVDVYRNGPKITATPNDGHYVNSRALPGSKSYVYQVCEAGSGVCSNMAVVSF